MNQLSRTILSLTLLLLAFCGSASADQESQTNPSFWDRFYGSYDATAKNWRDLPGIQVFSLSNGEPYIDMRPEPGTIEHRGTLGFELGDASMPFHGINSRIEFGGASEESTFKKQLNFPIRSDGGIAIHLKSPAIDVADLSGLAGSRNSYTFAHSHREYFFDYKWDYQPTPRLILTPKIGFIYSRLDQMHRLLLDVPEADGYRLITETVNGDALGVRTGLSLEVPLGNDFSFFFGSQITLNYNENDLDAHEFDSSLGEVAVGDKQTLLSHTTDLTVGIQKKILNAVVAVSGGVSFYSYTPRVVNPIKATDLDAHLEGQSAYSQYVQLSIAYEV